MPMIKSGLFLTLSLLVLALFFLGAGKVDALGSLDAQPVRASGALVSITPPSSDSPTPVATDRPTGGPPLSLTLTQLFTCCALGLVVGVLALGFILSMQKQKEEKKDKGS